MATALEPITRAGILLLDPTHIRWTSTELLGYLSDAQRIVAVNRPDLCTTTDEADLEPGASQVLEVEGALRLIEFTHNVTGQAVRIVDRDTLDRADPNWRRGEKSKVIEHYVFDPLKPLQFEVYPPAASGAALVGTWSRAPAALASTDDVLALDDLYIPTLVQLVCWMAHTKNGKGADPTKAASHLANASALLGVKLQMDALLSPASTRAAQVKQDEGSR